MKSNPEKVLARLWERELPAFWQNMAMNAPTDRYRNLYLAQLMEDPSVVKEFTEVHVGVRGVLMFCEKCLAEYENCHPLIAAYCANGHDPVQVRPANQIIAVSDAVTKHFIKRKLF